MKSDYLLEKSRSLFCFVYNVGEDQPNKHIYLLPGSNIPVDVKTDFFLRYAQCSSSGANLMTLQIIVEACMEPLRQSARGQLGCAAKQLHIQVDYSKHLYTDKLLCLHCSSRP